MNFRFFKSGNFLHTSIYPYFEDDPEPFSFISLIENLWGRQEGARIAQSLLVQVTCWTVGVRFKAGTSDFFCPSLHPDGVWGAPSFLSSGYLGIFCRGKSGAERGGIDHSPPLVPRSRLVEWYLHFPIFRHGIILNCRLQWPRGLRCELSSLARTLRSWVWIPLKAWMSVCAFILCLCCSGCR
jgi:hypothetical protein